MDALDAPPGSCVSGQNIWIENGKLKPRSGLTYMGTISDSLGTTDISSGVMHGIMVAHRAAPSVPTEHILVASGTTLVKFIGSATTEGSGKWSVLSAVSAGGKNVAVNFNGGATLYGATMYLPRTDTNLAVFGNGVSNIMVWDTESTGDGADVYSYLTGSPTPSAGPPLIAMFDNSPVVFFTPPTVQWPTGADPEDWTGVGSGQELLVDMIGTPSVILVDGDRMVLASDKEIWLGRKIGGAYRFSFAPLNRKMGMPFRKAVVQTPYGIFWLNSDYMVYGLAGNTITPVGQQILTTLRDRIALSRVVQKEVATFMTYNPGNHTVTLHYNTAVDLSPDDTHDAFTYHILERLWTPQKFGRGLSGGVTVNFDELDSTNYVRPNTYFCSDDGRVVGYSDETPLDAGTAKEAQFCSGGLFTGDIERIKFVDDIRLDVRADSASSLTVKTSGNLGGAYANSSEIAISAQSNSTQVRIFPKVSGTYFALQLTSEDTGWEVGRIGARARITGQSL